MITDRANPLVIFTDGSCKNFKNQKERKAKGHGGWAFIALHPGGNVYRSGFMHAPQTNNTAELTAVLRALQWIIKTGLEQEHVLIRPDSMYAINGMISGWLELEAETDFANVPNAKLWRSLHEYQKQIPRLKFLHVKGHAGHKYNEMCDRIASRARTQGP